MSLFSKCLKLDSNFRKPLDIGLIWEGNYWDDQDVHDCCDVDWETLEILVRKIGIALSDHHAPIDSSETETSLKFENVPQKIVIFLPKIMQLPLTILATHRIGFVSILMDPLTTNPSLLSSVVASEKPKLLVTVDSFWQAQQLVEVKSKIENLPGMDETQLLVIRHVAPNLGIPPPKKDIPARRPSYKTSMSLRDGRDLEWSTVMSEIKIEDLAGNLKISDSKGASEDYKWEDEDTVVVLYNENGSSSRITNSQLLQSLDDRKTGLEAKTTVSVENMMILETPRSLETLVDLLVPWFMGKTLTLYEGPLDYPDSSRLAQIISKHSVNCLLSSSPSPTTVIPNPEYLKFFPTPTLKIAEIFANELSL